MKFSELQKQLKEKFGATKLADIAREFDVTPQVVSNWKSRNYVPYKYVQSLRSKIQKAKDPFIPFNKLRIDLDHLSNFIEENKVEKVKHMLSNLVTSYQSNSEIVDHFYEQKSNSKNKLTSIKIVNSDQNKVIRIKT